MRRSARPALLAALALMVALVIPLAASRRPPTAAAGGDARGIAEHSVRGAVTDEDFYFVMADRFANGDTANDTGGLGSDPLVSGFDPTRTGFYHGGDLKGLLSKLDYIEGLGHRLRSG